MNDSTVFFPRSQSLPAKPHLLLVEDELSNRRFLEEVLEGEYVVEAVADGEEALAAVRRKLPDLIVADVQLPGLDGIQLTHRLRANALTAGVPIILITANNQKDLLFEGLAAGIDEFLLKPFDPFELLARLRCQRRMIDLRREASEHLARKEAEAVEEAKYRFFACLSHELRTPLTPVQFSLHLMSQTKGLPESVHAGFAMIRRNVEIETRLINDLLDISQIVGGKLELSVAPTDVHDCLGQALSDYRDELAARHLRLTVDLNATRHQVVGDATRLRQGFWHLLSNAAKFTPAGGAITVRSANDGDDIVIEVQDTGVGITTEALPKIFQPFEHGEFERVRTHGGLGLGLAISHAIVTAHEGSLTAESPGVNLGATFRVGLPLRNSLGQVRAL